MQQRGHGASYCDATFGKPIADSVVVVMYLKRVSIEYAVRRHLGQFV